MLSSDIFVVIFRFIYSLFGVYATIPIRSVIFIYLFFSLYICTIYGPSERVLWTYANIFLKNFFWLMLKMMIRFFFLKPILFQFWMKSQMTIVGIQEIFKKIYSIVALSFQNQQKRIKITKKNTRMLKNFCAIVQFFLAIDFKVKKSAHITHNNEIGGKKSMLPKWKSGKRSGLRGLRQRWCWWRLKINKQATEKKKPNNIHIILWRVDSVRLDVILIQFAKKEKKKKENFLLLPILMLMAFEETSVFLAQWAHLKGQFNWIKQKIT